MNLLTLASQQARSAGRAFGEAHGAYLDGPAVDTAAIITHLGGRVGVRASTSNRLLTIHSRVDFRVDVGRNTTPARDRFAQAQALGHYQLHYLNTPELLERHTNLQPVAAIIFDDEPKIQMRMCSEARLFARGLLMGGIDFDVTPADIPHLAREIQVSAVMLRQEVALAA